jgi:hypothetical protein
MRWVYSDSLTHAELQPEQHPADGPSEGTATAASAVQALHISSSTQLSSCSLVTNAAENLDPSEHLTCHLEITTFLLSCNRNVETQSVL